MVSQGKLEAGVANREGIMAGKWPGGYGAAISQELPAGISNCQSLKIRSTCNVLCSVIVKSLTKFIAKHYHSDVS